MSDSTTPPGLGEWVELGDLVTLATPARARYFLRAGSRPELERGLRFAQARGLPVLLLGGGSNVLPRGDLDGLVIQMALKGIEIRELDAGRCLVTAGAGEIWHDLVVTTVGLGYRGIENLALIPGTVGAAPVQNIGAYGVELEDCLQSVEVLDAQNFQVRRLSRDQCQFGYRQSLFKTAQGRHLIILRVTLELDRHRPLSTHYGDLARLLEQAEKPLGPEQVMDAVIQLRRSKLPDPRQLPNAGSFFKNPLVEREQFLELLARFPGLVHYPQEDGRYKLAAAWLIDQAGWRGYREGNVGVHERQALVLVNPGRGRGEEVLALAGRIRDSVRERYGVELEMEPVVL